MEKPLRSKDFRGFFYSDRPLRIAGGDMQIPAEAGKRHANRSCGLALLFTPSHEADAGDAEG
jgi:hypothetical protein